MRRAAFQHRVHRHHGEAGDRGAVSRGGAQGMAGGLQRLLGNQGVTDVLRSPGQPLPAGLRADMEARFGRDFGDVQIHSGEDAARAATNLRAKAYTIGRHIVFGAGRYAPDTTAGRELLAHELAHVVQQGRGGLPPGGETNGPIEQDARQAAAAAAHGDGPVQVDAASGVGIARDGDDTAFEERVRRELHDAMLAELFAPPADAAGGSNAPQANQPLLSILNGAFFGGSNPVGTLSTDVFSSFASQSTTDRSVGRTYLPSLTLQVRDRISPEGEVGVFGTIGGVFPSRLTTGALGLTYHHGPEAPQDETGYKFGWGYWLTASQVWGLEPPLSGPLTPPGWSFNPTGNAMLALSWARAQHGEADLILGAGLARWGQVNGVPVGGFLSPYLGFSYTKNLGDADSIYAEITGGPYLGLAGRYDAGTGFPASLYLAGGIGYQHTWGDYGLGVEPWLFGEPWSSVSSPATDDFSAGPRSNWGLGLRFNLTAINPRRRRYSDE